MIIGDTRAAYTRRHISAAHVDAELARVAKAVGEAQAGLREVSRRMASGSTPDQSAILDAYIAMLTDPMLHERVERKIRSERKCAEWAVAATSHEIVSLFRQNTTEHDAYVTERRHDIEFVCDRLLRALMGEPSTLVPQLDRPTVIIARDLSPADTAGMVKEPVIAIVTEVGTRTSHTAIMARALEIPAVVGTVDALHSIRGGDIVIVDGLRGEVIVNPSPAVLDAARMRAARHLAFGRRLLVSRHERSVTSCGEPISLKANVELPAEAILALDHGAEGIGLYRTEFLYIDRISQPDEQEQYELYSAVVEAVSPRSVTLRTFDIGGDKYANSFQLPNETNPALGLRAVRLALSQPDVFLTQLRAMVRASAHGHLRIMIPMIASIDELRDVRNLLNRAIREVKEEGLPCADHIPLGMMIEVPSAALMADVFAREAEFFSLGTNDLIQYTLAIDRTNRLLAPLASAFHPAIVRMIQSCTLAAKRNDIPISMCGAMASDPLAAVLSVGLGLRDLSMEAAAIPEIKETMRRVSLAECEAIAEAALLCDSADAVEDLVAKRFAPRLYDLLSGEGGDLDIFV